jgi:nitrogen-specific signal transduction histidine kinase
MNSVSKLARPICCEIDSDGRLIRADEALRKLNQRAGGDEGGALAIPALWNLAQLSLKLKMRLSRGVRVADAAENVELWVEAQPKGDVAYLSILSWRTLPTALSADGWFNPDPPVPTIEYPSLQFDTSSRLIRATGTAAEGLSSVDFGQAASTIIYRLFGEDGGTVELVGSIHEQKAFPPLSLKRNLDGKTLLVSGTLIYDSAGASGVYQCRFDEMPETNRAPINTGVNATAGALFGKHLAPVLRQPLGRIIANAETIGSELQGPIRENYALYARDIANAARHLSALVDDLGDLEAVERADFQTAKDKIELGDVARRVAGLLALKAADHSIRISAPPETDKVPAAAEFRRVLQVMLNLVTNAVRYSPDGTDVLIETTSKDDGAYISVSDQGSGIAEEDRDKVFEKFERLGRSGDGGSGLGLYISRRLARAMGGDLTVSKAASGGAQFTLRLPIA